MKVRKITVQFFNPAEAARQGLDEPGWWLFDPNNPDVKWNGPYGTKAEANEDRIGLERFWKDDYKNSDCESVGQSQD